MELRDLSCPIQSKSSTSTPHSSREGEPQPPCNVMPETESHHLSDIDGDEELEHTEVEPLGYTSDGDQILSKSRCRSEIWDHFQKVKQKKDGAEKARCLYCKKKYVGHAKSGTSHLKEHVKSCYSKKSVDNKQKFLTRGAMMGEGRKSSIQSYSYDPDYARKQLAYMIILHEYPLSMVDHVGFKRFCHSLNPAFHVVSRNTLKKDILKIYDVERVKTMRFMGRSKGKISLTTDMWTSSNKKKGFMVVTAHFIDDSWKLQSRIIRFVYVPCPHTGEALSEVLMDTLLEWNIDRKLSTLTVDNATTNDAMINILLEKFGSDNVWCKAFFQVRCAAHILNLIVKDGLDVIKSSIEKIRDIVAYWIATPKRLETFEDASRQVGITYGKNMALDVPTRWNSTFLMLESAMEYKSVFSRLKLKDFHYKCCPADDDWNLAKDICERLEVFYKVTLLFSGTSYPTSNLFFPEVCNIKVRLTEWSCCGNYLVEEMALNMIEKYDKYWDNTHGFLAVAVVLDPRFKMSLITYYYKRIYGDHGVSMAEDIRNRCYDLLTLYESKKSGDSSSKSSESLSKPPSAPSSTYFKNRSSLSDYVLELDQQKKGKTAHVKSELDTYLEEEQFPLTSEEFDILAWWKSNGIKYPTLQAIAKDLLVVPVSTVASESSFSTSGRVVSENRNRLHPKTLEALMCTQSWLVALENEEIHTIHDEDMDVDESANGMTMVDD